MDTIEREIEKIVFVNNDEQFIIAKTTSKDSVLGKFREVDPIMPGIVYKFTGEFSESKFGKQLTFTNYRSVRAVSRTGVVKFFDRICKGIGPQTANKIYDKYRDNSITAIRDNPESVWPKIFGLTEKIANDASEAIKRHGNHAELYAELAELFSGRGFPEDAYKDAIEAWGADAPLIIRNNPFMLLVREISGAGFKRVDAMYLSLGHAPGNILRQTYAIEHIVRSMSGGSTWVDRKWVKRQLGEMIAASRADEAETAAINDNLVVISKCQNWMSLRIWAEAEDKLGRIVSAKLEENSYWPTVIEGISDHQQKQLNIALSRRIGIFEGRGGTGKTYTLARLVKSLPPTEVLCIAPTGKAAVRMTENLRDAGCNVQAMTGHRALRYQGPGGNGTGLFEHNEKNPLPFLYVIADEQSMLGTMMGHAIFSACGRDTHILLTGDDGQLPPIDHGCVFQDLKRCGVPVGTLTKVHRYSGNVSDVANLIRNGGAPDHKSLPNKLDLDEGINFTAKQISSEIQVRTKVVTLARDFPFDKIWDLQFIAAVKKGATGCIQINKLIQNTVNLKSESIDGVDFRKNDKVLNVKNGTMNLALREWEEFRDEDLPPAKWKDDTTTYIANGEQGIVLHAAKTHAIIEFRYPERIVFLKRTEFNRIELAYCITVHKSQGSQWPFIVAIVDKNRGARMIGSRQLWYTAITRMETMCLVIGDLNAMRQDIKRDELTNRKTLLKEIIEEGMKQTTIGIDA